PLRPTPKHHPSGPTPEALSLRLTPESTTPPGRAESIALWLAPESAAFRGTDGEHHLRLHAGSVIVRLAPGAPPSGRRREHRQRSWTAHATRLDGPDGHRGGNDAARRGQGGIQQPGKRPGDAAAGGEEP